MSQQANCFWPAEDNAPIDKAVQDMGGIGEVGGINPVAEQSASCTIGMQEACKRGQSEAHFHLKKRSCMACRSSPHRCGPSCKSLATSTAA